MRRYLSFMLVLVGLAAVFASCRHEGVEESSCPYALMHDGVTYYYTGEAIYEKIKITEDAVLGRVTSVIPESGMPQVDGQANIDILGSIYINALSGDGLLVLIDGEWTVFEKREVKGKEK